MGRLLALVGLLIAGLMAALLVDRPEPRADLVYIERMDPNTLDVGKITWTHENRLATCLYEGLVRNDIFSREFRQTPALAARWTVSADGLKYTFTLRPNAKWSNGVRVKAGDFVYSWRRGLLPDGAGDYAGMFMLVKGGRDFFQWREKAQREFQAQSRGRARPAEAEALWQRTAERFDQTVGIHAPDDDTVVIDLERPTPYFLEILAYEPMGPVYPPLVETFTALDAVSGLMRNDAGWTKPGVMITCGPMKLADWRYRREVRLEKNPYYWNLGAVNVDSVALASVADSGTAVMAIESGSADLVLDINAPFKGDLLAKRAAYEAKFAKEIAAWEAEGLDPIEIDRRLPYDPALNVRPLKTFGTYFLNFNCMARLSDGRPNPFSDNRVRRAFAMAIDRGNIAANVRRGGEMPTGVLVPKGSIAGYASPQGLPSAPDPAAIATARGLLAAAGYPGGQGFLTVEYVFNKDGGHDLVAQAVKNDWEQNLGVQVRLKQVELKQFRDDLKQGNFMVSRASWFGDYTDPMTFLDLSRTGDGNNDRRYSSERFDKLLADAEGERDAQKRLAILSAAERILVEEDLPLAPVLQYVEVYMYDPRRVANISPHVRLKQFPWMLDILGDGKGAERGKMMRSTGDASQGDLSDSAAPPARARDEGVPRGAAAPAPARAGAP
ncbi:peptide ABC transporter substrate-binding protein [soil metagenome]